METERSVIMFEGIVLRNVHDWRQCQRGSDEAGRHCVIHYPSKHHMRLWPLIWRDDRGIFERQCPHGVGHPDPDQFPYWNERGLDGESIHGCDGCCRPPMIRQEDLWGSSQGPSTSTATTASVAPYGGSAFAPSVDDVRRRHGREDHQV